MLLESRITLKIKSLEDCKAFVAALAIMSELDEGSNESVVGSTSSKQPEKVEVNEYGLPISENSGKISSRMGALVRTHVPISYESWDKVPERYKEDVWCELLWIAKMADPWRKFKSTLRRKSYDEYQTYEERIRNPPKNVSYEDWEQFCKNEGTKSAQDRRTQGRINRSFYSYSHSTGRTGHAVVEARLIKANPNKKITRRNVWEKTHSQRQMVYSSDSEENDIEDIAMWFPATSDKLRDDCDLNPVFVLPKGDVRGSYEDPHLLDEHTPTFSPLNQFHSDYCFPKHLSFVLIKPVAVRDRCVGEIILMLENICDGLKGVKLVDLADFPGTVESFPSSFSSGIVEDNHQHVIALVLNDFSVQYLDVTNNGDKSYCYNAETEKMQIDRFLSEYCFPKHLSFALIKPVAVQDRRVGEIILMLERNCFGLKGVKLVDLADFPGTVESFPSSFSSGVVEDNHQLAIALVMNDFSVQNVEVTSNGDKSCYSDNETHRMQIDCNLFYISKSAEEVWKLACLFFPHGVVLWPEPNCKRILEASLVGL